MTKYTKYTSRHNKYIWEYNVLSKEATQWWHFNYWFFKDIKRELINLDNLNILSIVLIYYFNSSLHHLHFKHVGE